MGNSYATIFFYIYFYIFYNYKKCKKESDIMTDLWKHDNFINENYFYLVNKEITEYDMKEGGFSLVQEYNLLDEKTITELKKMGKEKRKIQLGKIQRSDEIFKEKLKKAFQYARKLFVENNNLEDDDILSIKKDAIITTKYCPNHQVGKFVDFRPKHDYTSYIKLDTRLEIYYSPYDFAVKGIGDEMLAYHENYMIKFIKSYFNKLETSATEDVIEYVRNFIDRYKSLDLDVGYYRNFNIKSDYTIINDDTSYMTYWEDQKSDIDISYNYYNLLLKLIKVPL